jgi:hypothetical protein
MKTAMAFRAMMRIMVLRVMKMVMVLRNYEELLKVIAHCPNELVTENDLRK